jgi:uncharacterized protein YjbJ (UPF0337 family)
MDKDNIKGKAKDIAGRAQRQMGEWTGSEEDQAEGARKQGEGKVQNAWGNVKEGARDLKDDLEDAVERDRPRNKDAA